MGEWLIPWRERGRSGPVNDNLLWHHDRLYIMDNHRLALWCWWQRLAESIHWHYLHIDRHYDSLWQTFAPWPEHTRPTHRENLSEFRAATVNLRDGGDPSELYRWDTITSALWSLHREQLAEVSLATANEGDVPAIPQARHVDPWGLPAHVSHLAERGDEPDYPRVVDVDVDYFSRRDVGGTFGPVFSDDYVAEVGRALRRGLDTGRFGVVTIALSPETTGSWTLAERLLSVLLASFPEYGEFVAGAP
jgi:hypothetical protein